jgi:predicted MFS family arabinose efflux permease
MDPLGRSRQLYLGAGAGMLCGGCEGERERHAPYGTGLVSGFTFAEIARRPGTVRALGPALVGRIPDSIAGTCIVVLVRTVTGSFAAAGVAAGAFSVGMAVSAPFAGRTMDRIGQRRVLPVMAAAFGAVLVVIALAAGALGGAGIACLAAVAGLTRPPLEAAMRALWPALVPPSQLDAAYALDSTVQELIWIAGPLLLAALLATGLPRLPLLACAGLSVAGTVAYAAGTRTGGNDWATRDGRTGGDGRATGDGGTRRPLSSGRLRVLLGSVLLYGVSTGILTVSLVAFATAHGGAGWAGVLIAIWGVASLVGGITFGGRNWRWPVERRAMAYLGAFAAALALLAAAPSLPWLALAMIPLGLPLAPWLGSLSASVQRASPAGATTEAFTWTFAVVTVGQSAGSAAGGMIIQGAGVAAAFVAAAGACAIGTALGLAFLGRVSRDGGAAR